VGRCDGCDEDPDLGRVGCKTTLDGGGTELRGAGCPW